MRILNVSLETKVSATVIANKGETSLDSRIMWPEKVDEKPLPTAVGLVADARQLLG